MHTGTLKYSLVLLGLFGAHRLPLVLPLEQLAQLLAARVRLDEAVEVRVDLAHQHIEFKPIVIKL